MLCRRVRRFPPSCQQADLIEVVPLRKYFRSLLGHLSDSFRKWTHPSVAAERRGYGDTKVLQVAPWRTKSACGFF